MFVPKQKTPMSDDFEELLFLSTFLSSNKPLELIKQILMPAIAPMIITDAGTLDGGYKIVYANKAFLKITGYELAELVGQSPKIFQGPQSNQAILTQLSVDLKEKGFFHGASMNYRKDGSCYPVEWQIHPIRDDNGEIQFFISVQKDLSSLLRVTEQVKEVNEYFRHFMADVSSGKITSENIKETGKEYLESVKDTAKLYSAPTKETEDDDLFGDVFFDFDAEDEEGIIEDKSEKPAITAQEYMNEERMSGDELEALLDIVDDLEEEIELLSNDASQLSRLMSAERQIREMSDAIFFLIDFTDTAMALNEVADCLQSVTKEQLDGYLVMFLKSLTAELRTWLNGVFVEKTSANIYDGEVMIIAAAKQIVTILKQAA